jgi:prepilin-type processing-associated H-X9-DG protein
MENSTSAFFCPTDAVSNQNIAINNYTISSSDNQFTLIGTAVCEESSDESFRTAVEITDGASQTVMFSERLANPYLADVDLPDSDYDAYARRHERRYSWYTPTVLMFKENMDAFRAACNADVPFTSEPVNELTRQLDTFYVQGHEHDHFMPPNSRACINGPPEDPVTQADGWEHGTFPATSEHRGGAVHVAFVDGHVSTISKSIDLKAWHAMGTINAGDSASGALR